MFRSDAANFGTTEQENETNLRALGAAMSASFDAPKNGEDDEESGIPALYTYFGQFVDHDITFDPASSLQQQNDPDALVDFRTPALDLDNVYRRALPQPDGHRQSVAAVPAVQKLVRFHYQYVVLNDFLPRIVHSTVLEALKDDGRYAAHRLKFFKWKHDPFMPVEFSVAAYRLGHSMVRPGYRLNDNILLPIFPVPSQGLPEGLTAFRAMIPQWGLDWGRFVDFDIRKYDGSAADRAKRLQFADRIDTSLVNPLAGLPAAIASNPSSLAERNLLRAWRLGLPSGQSVAKAMGVTPLKDQQIFIGKATGIAGDAKSIDDPSLALPAVFKKNCPLWTYILAEAMQHREYVKIPVQETVTIATPKLGPVGGRIVAEVFLGLMFGDRNSLLSLDPDWQPAGGANYGLKDLIKFALGQ